MFLFQQKKVVWKLYTWEILYLKIQGKRGGGEEREQDAAEKDEAKLLIQNQAQDLSFCHISFYYL